MSNNLPEGLKFRAFLSYRSSDRKLATWLHGKLESYRIPKRLVGKPGRFGPVPARLTPVFRDRDDARGASDIETTIKDYLAQAEQLIVVCTPSSAQPDCWVGREIELFKRVRPGAEIHAIIGAGSPPACIPKQLVRHASDGSVHSPLAGDLRPVAKGGDGPHRGFIKLVAGLIGVEFDDLWQRERRRWQLATLLWSVVIAVTLVAGATWLRQREAGRLAGIASTAQRLDRTTNGALIDLLTIAAAPPATGSLIAPNDQQREGLEAISRRARPAFVGSVAMRHQDLNARAAFRSKDGRLVFSMASYDDRGLFVWNAAENKLVARIPVDLNYWLPGATDTFRDRDRGKAMGLDVSDDGQFIAAVYAPVKGTHWIAAAWQLDTHGACAAPCLPKTFLFEIPAPPPKHFLGEPTGELRLSADTKSALFVMPGAAPYAIDFNAHKVEPLASLADSDLARCVFAVPATALPEERVPKSDRALSPLPPPPPNEEGRWFSDDGKYMARLRFGDRIVKFYSQASRREVARLELPATTQCITDCNVNVTFLDHDHEAAVSSREVNGADVAAGRVFGVVSLDACEFSAWPEVGPVSLLSDQLPHAKDKSWRVHRVSSHVASRTGTHIAAVMTLSGDGYKDVGVIFGIKERRPVALFFPSTVGPDAVSIEALQAVDGDYAFRAWIESGLVPVRVDGTLGTFQRASAEGTPVSFWGGQVPLWQSEQNYGWEPMQWQLPSAELSVSPAVVDVYADKISEYAVAANAGTLALAQSGSIFVQPAGPDAIAKAITIKLAAAKYDAIRFSPDAKVLAAVWAAKIGDDEPNIVSVWSSATGVLIAELAQDSRTRLLAVDNDASVFIEKSGEALRLNPRTGESKLIVQMRYGRMVWRGAQLLADDGNGHLMTVEPSTLSVAALANLPKGQRLVNVSPDGKTIYSSDFLSDYFVNLDNALRHQFLSNQETGASSFSRSGKLVLVTGKFIDVWDPVGLERIARYAGPWENVSAVWLSADNRELWALDSHGLLYRWNLANDYAASVASACETLKDSGAPLEFTDNQMAAFPQLGWAERMPCSRVGPLSLHYYIQLFERLIGR
jgi:MTH538 TIR-like domain (DUF1863)